MPSQFIVFQDSVRGLRCLPALSGATLAETIELIQTRPSQNWMYFIYRLHTEKLPVYKTKLDCYQYVKAVAGSSIVSGAGINTRGLDYALTDWEGGWMFSDDIFGDHS